MSGCQGHEDLNFIKETVVRLEQKFDKVVGVATKNEVKTKSNTRHIWAIWTIILASGGYLIQLLLGAKS